MKENIGIQKTFIRDPKVQDWLCYEFVEEDFLLGKTPKFSPDIEEDDE